MATFLIKVNAKRNRVPGGIARPRGITDWHEMKFSVPRVKSKPSLFSNNVVGPRLTPGDEFFVWVNEASGGGGLTAHAKLLTVEETDDDWELSAVDLRLLDRPIDMGMASARSSDSLILQRIEKYRLEKLWALSEAETSMFHALAGVSGALRAADADDDALRTALSSDRARIQEADRDRRMALQKMRPGQKAFRAAAMLRHRGRCIVTRCSVPEALEAAHVIPHTGEPMFERADNSLILRRDVHALFDAFMISIDPHTDAIEVAPSLDDTVYAKLSGRRVDHQLARPALEHHFAVFRSAME